MKGLTTYNLDNGLKVFLKEDVYSPVSSIFVWVNTGSAYEDDSQRGLAHVHEHMIFKGTENLMVGEISCLLYTSPSPRDRGCSRMPSSA